MWKEILRSNFTNISLLADFLLLTDEQRAQCITRKSFPLNMPRRLAEKCVKGTLDDPILRQFLPTQQEEVITLGYKDDPVEDSACRLSSKLLHKYQGRVLLVCTSACAMHCRYCFRQHFDYAVKVHGFEEELKLIAADETIREVILSGGDPLSFSDNILGNLLEVIAEIPHVQRIRFHTRFPIGIPERIDDSLCSMLEKIPKKIWMVIHANHPLELDNDVLSHLKKLQTLGIVLLNQSVLLRGVNDDIEVLTSLCEKLVDNGILPYYLHQYDKVQGGAHFEVPVEEGLHLMKGLETRLSGYAVPKYVREIAGEPSKTLLW